VTPDPASVVNEYKAGKVEFRNDKGGNVQAIVGKLSFDNDKLAANIAAFIDKVVGMKPSAVKGIYVKSVYISATMSPSVRLAV
jgi:large subunit ribosomal protein L1